MERLDWLEPSTCMVGGQDDRNVASGAFLMQCLVPMLPGQAQQVATLGGRPATAAAQS